MIQLNTLPGQVLDNKYRIERLLGRGGMGAVYLAQHLGTRRMVALKVIVPNKAATTEYLDRFRREAEAAGMLRHPNVVDVTDFGVTDVGGSSIAYLVMEYLDGCDLQMILAEEQRLPVPFAVEILHQTCSAVAEAHRRGIIHRDLKPANIWLEPDRLGGYNVKVLDFGLAKTDGVTIGTTPEASPATGSLPDIVPYTGASSAPSDRGPDPSGAAADEQTRAFPVAGVADEEHEGSTILQPLPADAPDEDAQKTEVQARVSTSENSSSLTRIGSIMGSPGYMSPEQCRGEAVDWRSDIYSIGVIAYEMLTGAKPFAGGDLHAILRQTVEETPAPMKSFRPELPDSVCEVVMKAIAKQPEDRPQSAAVFGSTLRASAMGIGELLKVALTKFTENVGVFMKVFAIGYLPFFAIRLVLNVFAIDNSSTRREIIAFLLLLFVGVVGNFVAMALTRGLSAVVYSLSIAMPASTINFRLLLGRIRATGQNLVKASFVYFGMITLPMTLFGASILFAIFSADRWESRGIVASAGIARIVAIVLAVLFGTLLVRNLPRASMLPIVALVEGTPYRESIARSRALGELDPLLVIGLGLTETIVWFGLQTVRFVALLLVIYVPVERFGSALVDDVDAVELGALVLSMAIEIVIGPLLALVFAALYLKLRLGSGETMESIVSKQFVLPDTPHTGWQQRMQKRLSSQV